MKRKEFFHAVFPFADISRIRCCDIDPTWCDRYCLKSNQDDCRKCWEKDMLLIDLNTPIYSLIKRFSLVKFLKDRMQNGVSCEEIAADLSILAPLEGRPFIGDQIDGHEIKKEWCE